MPMACQIYISYVIYLPEWVYNVYPRTCKPSCTPLTPVTNYLDDQMFSLQLEHLGGCPLTRLLYYCMPPLIVLWEHANLYRSCIGSRSRATETFPRLIASVLYHSTFFPETWGFFSPGKIFWVQTTVPSNFFSKRNTMNPFLRMYNVHLQNKSILTPLLKPIKEVPVYISQLAWGAMWPIIAKFHSIQIQQPQNNIRIQFNY